MSGPLTTEELELMLVVLHCSYTGLSGYDETVHDRLVDTVYWKAIFRYFPTTIRTTAQPLTEKKLLIEMFAPDSIGLSPQPAYNWAVENGYFPDWQGSNVLWPNGIVPASEHVHPNGVAPAADRDPRFIDWLEAHWFPKLSQASPICDALKELRNETDYVLRSEYTPEQADQANQRIDQAVQRGVIDKTRADEWKSGIAVRKK